MKKSQTKMGRQKPGGKRSRTRKISTGAHNQFGPLPLIIGITGHRDLYAEDIPKLESLLERQLESLATEFSSTNLVILTALAEGSDRLAARVALKMGYRLVVPLPMPEESYEEDFDESSRAEFRDLLAKAEHSFVLPLVGKNTTESIHSARADRDEQYTQLGAYLASQSALMIAFWNGIVTKLPGGTSQIVHFKLEGVPEPYSHFHSELDAPDSGVVHQIVTRRRSEPHVLGTPLTEKMLYPAGFDSLADAKKAYFDIYERMDLFNQDTLKHSEELLEHRKESKNHLFPPTYHNALSPLLRETLDCYSTADLLSQRFQKHTVATLKVILGLVFMAAVSYDLYSHLFDGMNFIMGLYLLMFFLSYLWHTRAARAGYQTKYLDYRAVAEGLRVQFFWKLAGLGDSVADFYMRKQKSELDWVRYAVRSSTTQTCGDSADASTDEMPLAERLKLVQKHWIEDQAKYFAKAAHREHERLHKHERTISVLFGLALLTAAIQVLIPATPILIILIGLLPVLAALIHTFVQKNALMEHSKQYDRMSVLFHRALLHLEKLLAENRHTDAQSFITELGREALYENGDWILTHRERPLEVPKA